MLAENVDHRHLKMLKLAIRAMLVIGLAHYFLTVLKLLTHLIDKSTHIYRDYLNGKERPADHNIYHQCRISYNLTSVTIWILQRDANMFEGL